MRVQLAGYYADTTAAVVRVAAALLLCGSDPVDIGASSHVAAVAAAVDFTTLCLLLLPPPLLLLLLLRGARTSDRCRAGMCIRELKELWPLAALVAEAVAVHTSGDGAPAHSCCCASSVCAACAPGVAFIRRCRRLRCAGPAASRFDDLHAVIQRWHLDDFWSRRMLLDVSGRAPPSPCAPAACTASDDGGGPPGKRREGTRRGRAPDWRAPERAGLFHARSVVCLFFVCMLCVVDDSIPRASLFLLHAVALAD